jgi:hypothetical protein
MNRSLVPEGTWTWPTSGNAPNLRIMAFQLPTTVALIPLLTAKGFHAVAVQNPLSSIADDVASTRRGAVITESGDNPKVVGLVYVAAFAPDEGEKLGGMAQKFLPTPGFGEIEPIADGHLLLTRKGVRENFAQDLSASDNDLVYATQGATQGAILGTPIRKAAWHTRPSWLSLPRMTARSHPTRNAARLSE